MRGRMIGATLLVAGFLVGATGPADAVRGGRIRAGGAGQSARLGDGTLVAHRNLEVISARSGSALHGVRVLALATGAHHSLALGSNGHVYAWGGNSSGELGDGTITAQDSPEDISVRSGSALHGVRVLALAAGLDHSLALGSNGHVYAWGGNLDGELGDGELPNNQESPEDISARSGSVLHGVRVLALAAGDVQSLALGSNGHVYAWGGNSYGELGDGTTSPRNSPEDISARSGSALHGVPVLALATASDTSAGAGHSLALGSNGHVYAWGYNYDGELADGTSIERDSPEDISARSGSVLHGVRVLALAAGNVQSLALGGNGHVYVWGGNSYGELGDCTTAPRYSPEDISAGCASALPGVPFQVSARSRSALHGVRVLALAAGLDHSLALGSNGHVYAWGGNSSGDLGDGTFSPRYNPEDISARSGSALHGERVLALASGFDHSLALGSNGHVYAWGSNDSGALGDGTPNDQESPEDISAISK